MFGATIRGIPFVAPSTIIRSPRSLVLEDRACLGPASEIYNLATVTVRSGATVSQQAYICGGTHDFSQAEMPLVTGDIEIGQDAFIGARAFVMPGVTIGYCAVVGACAVVTRDVGAFAVVAGNPARVIGRRQIGKAGND